MKKRRIGKVVIGGEKFSIRNEEGEPQFTIQNLFWCPWFGLDKRWIHVPNEWPGPLHNHREGFVRMILHGGYVEVREGNKWKTYRPGNINRIDKDTFHCFPRLLSVPTVTIGFTLNWRGEHTPEVLLQDGTRMLLRDYLADKEVSAPIARTMA